MTRRITAVLFAFALFFGALTLSTAQAPATAPALDLLETPAWMVSQEVLSFGCTYSACMRHCDEVWATCHEVCNRDCDAQR